ncbi:MAG: intradiol ring-cleavage dioxygenase [Actinobacteria bacterium]|nr:intradiol ring-cleavage dioxygenase [Actinomycetota bacterium]
MEKDGAKKDGSGVPRIRYLSRREMLALIGSTAAAVTFAGCGGSEQSGQPGAGETTGGSTSAAGGSTGGETTGAAAETASTTCVVKPEQTEGPYYVDVGLDRSDIREEREGVPLELTFNVSRVDQGEVSACGPLAGALVDVWHCDALGVYSGVEDNAAGDFDTRGQTFLRGYQVTDDNGVARFTTIYPGWYRGRVVHIHFTIRDSAESEQGYEFTSQLYFDDALTDQVFAEGPYAEKGERDQRNSTDGIYQGGGDEMLLALTPNGQGYAATFDIALDTTYA